MKYYYIIISLIILFSCQSEKYQEIKDVKETQIIPLEPDTLVNEELTSIECATGHIINSNDSFSCKKYTDSIVYYYEDYVVNTQRHIEYNGDVVSITDKTTNGFIEIGKEESCFFVGIYQHYAIIDEGTGQMRTLSIYDISQQEMIFTTSYVNEITLKKSELFFDDKVEIEDQTKIPECSKELQEIEYGIGYVEHFIYSFEQNELTRTGKYECCYFE